MGPVLILFVVLALLGAGALLRRWWRDDDVDGWHRTLDTLRTATEAEAPATAQDVAAAAPRVPQSNVRVLHGRRPAADAGSADTDGDADEDVRTAA